MLIGKPRPTGHFELGTGGDVGELQAIHIDAGALVLSA